MHASAAETQDGSFAAACSELFSVAYRTAYPITGSREVSEDLAQEALVRAYVRWSRVGAYAHPWVARVALNLALDHTRRRVPSVDPEQAMTHDRYVAERVDLQLALRRLPKRQRQVVVLRHLADQSDAAIASLLGIGVATVKTHAARGLAALRLLLTTENEDGHV